MRLIVRFVSYCILAFTCFTAAAQQRMLQITDTTYVPVVEEATTFYNHNYMYKARLDSIQKIVPLSYNEYVQKYIDIYAGRKDMMGKMLGLSGYYFPIFEKALKSYNIPEEIKYLPIIESSMNPHAVSRVGATGLWQFMFATAKGYGLNMDNFVDERKDPIQASYAAAAYFRDAYEELGDWLLAIAAYNCGMGNVNRAIAKADSRDFWEIRRFLPMETRNYVPAFIAAVYVMNYSGKHEIKAQRTVFLKNTDTIQVNRFVSLPSLAEALNIEVEELWSLNPSYKKKIVNGSELSPKRVILPKVSLASFTRVYELLNETEADVDKHIILASNDNQLKRKSKAERKSPIVYHKVAPGQSLIGIANKYHVEVQDLKVWNNLKGSTIVPGQRLKIYSNTEGRHTAAPLRG
ncbi:lytic transglycosylase domain-containing protein [Pedobacter heparinus]|uniref:Lytic transglycosylase catalytic n=1 Tax=Pedobacter heparinus (strain ATCC 13125 / DSM 2366 / CIP 104194 / JCM 7457 / NBRC 12017 / NCIMB 9290 / NRRL B-14731 / HIM 762-3) TaxID=485917 RepID=C6XV17_PEDHD|nr:lytic transglycosylase domain-containing protein [Pedobacter heparinus]ACU06025.1 Lytic transglycosylase catalytic [Pedobacter heparinus DSM 2366]